MTAASLRDWLARAPEGTMLPAAEVLAQLNEGETIAPNHSRAEATAPASWRERLWTCAPETRLGVLELAEALSRPKSWVHRHTSQKSGVPLLPHRKLEGALVFVASEVRTWLTEHEQRCTEPQPAPFVFGNRGSGRRRRHHAPGSA